MKKTIHLGNHFSHSLKKAYLIMRIAIIFFIAGVLQAGAIEIYSQNARLSLDFSDSELIKVLGNIEEKSEFYFFFNDKLLNIDRKVNINVNDEPIGEILDNLFAGTDINYTIIDRKIILAPKYITDGPGQSVKEQQHSITGVVTDVNGEALPGVNIVLKGTLTGTATDIEGMYTINTPDLTGTLVFTFIGYVSQEVPVNGRNSINVTLAEELTVLGDVVVTALGIQREAKTLTYSSQQVSGVEMMKAKDINFMNALSGKTAGLEIKRAASGAGGSTKTVIRGAKSFSSNSSPLYVVDGVPIVNNLGGQASLWGGTDEGDGISQLNPDDIESISILKGANAAILYGSQGANGVIMITTKKGTEGSVDVSIGNATIFESVSIWPELQYKYGSVDGAKESWGDIPLTNPGFREKDLKNFFQSGYNTVSNISISGGTKALTGYFSYANTAARGIIPNNNYLKHNLSLRLLSKFFKEKVTVSSNLMLTDEMTRNRPRSGYTLNPLTGLYWFPRDKNVSEYRDGDNYKVMDPVRSYHVQNWFVDDHHQSNPWWVINMQPRWDGNKRAITSVNIDWKIAKGLNFTVKGTYDYANKLNEQRHHSGSNSVQCAPNGSWDYRKVTDWLTYVDGLLTYNNNFGNFSLNAVVGGSTQEYRYGDGISVNTGTNDLLYPNEFFFQTVPTETVTIQSVLSSRGIKHGLFGNASIGFKEMIFLDLSGRNDWSSTLAFTNNYSYFYPAVGFSAIISQMVSLPNFINFGKVRGSYTTVANEVGFDAINPDGAITGSAKTVGVPSRPPFFDARPEMLTSIEAGTDWRFLDGKLGFDFTYYNIVSTDQFLDVLALQGVGFERKYLNAGKIVNQGIELMINAEPVATNDFSWTTALNFTRNVNKIKEVNPNDPNQRVALGNVEGYYSYIAPGGSFGDLYTLKYRYDDAGRLLLDNKYQPLKTSEPEKVGSINPDFSLGWNNAFSYKRWSMGFLINGIFGGNVVSQTECMFDGMGLSKRSADARDNGGVDVNGIVSMPGAPNEGELVDKVDAKVWYLIVGGRNGILEQYIYDRTNVRLTQFSLNYDVPVRALNLPVKSASVALVGQNLFFLFRNAPYDPEVTMSAGRDSQGLDNYNMPSTRSYGFNVKVNF